MTKGARVLADDHEETLEWVRIVLNGHFDIVSAVRKRRDAVAEV
jgi:hypothetical protein